MLSSSNMNLTEIETCVKLYSLETKVGLSFRLKSEKMQQSCDVLKI